MESSFQSTNSLHDNYITLLKRSLSIHNIICSHEFLNIKEEARLEHVALMNNDNNDVIRDMMSDIGISVDNNNIIIVSVGTSSTQCYSYSTDIPLTQYYYIGSDSILNNSALVIELLNRIKNVIDSHSNSNHPIVFINSISKWLKKTICFNNIVNDDELISYIDSNDNNNHNSVLQVLLSLSKLSKSIENPIIISTSNIDNSWGSYKIRELYSEYMNITNHLYFIDFGGGGINLKYHNYETGISTSIAKNRILLTYTQERFINEILNNAIEYSPVYESVINFIHNNIITHAKDNNISNDKYYLKIVQTGKIRQYAHIGNLESIV